MYRLRFKKQGLSEGITFDLDTPIDVNLTLDVHGIEPDYCFEVQCWCEDDIEESVFDAEDFVVERV